MTRLDMVLKQLHISLWNILIFHWKIFYLHLQSSSASKKWKNANFLRFADLVHRVRRDPSVTLRKFSPDTTGHGLQITKRPAVWYFSIFLFEKYQFLLEIFYLHLESSSASRKWKNLNVVLFADSVHRVRRDPSVTLKKIFLRILQDKIQNTVKWRTANVFTVKLLTICSGWLLRKTILERFQWSGNFVLREIGLRRALHQGWKWAFKSGLSVELSEPLSVNEVFWCC